MWLINHFMNFVFDRVMGPFQVRSPWPGLIATSLLTAVVLVALFSVSSNQAAIRRSRNRFLARTLELLLFQHDLRVSLTACGRLFAANFSYLFQFLLPMAVGLIPLVLIFVQMEAWFDRRPLRVGEQAVLTVQLDPTISVVGAPVILELPDTVRQDSWAVRIPNRNELAWRLVAIKTGAASAKVKVGYDAADKSLVVGANVTRVSPRRESRGWANQLFAPSETPLANMSPVRRMEISYPAREISLGLTEIPWIIAAIVLMMLFSLILGWMFGVRIA